MLNADCVECSIQKGVACNIFMWFYVIFSLLVLYILVYICAEVPGFKAILGVEGWLGRLWGLDPRIGRPK